MAFMSIEQAYDHPIEQSLRIIAAESLAPTSSMGLISAFTNLISKTEEGLSLLVAPIREFSLTMGKPKDYLTKDQRKSLEVLSKMSFMAYQRTLVMVPEGFKGDLLEYLKFLENARSEIVKHAYEVVNQYGIELSIFISNPSARNGAKLDDRLYADLEKLHQQQSKHLSSYFDSKKTLSRAPLGDVVKRFSDFEPIFAIAERITKSQNNNKQLSELLTAVDHAAGLLKIIRTNLEGNKEQTVSGDMAHHISKGAYVIGKYVELASSVIYATEVALASVSSLSDQFQKLTLDMID